MRRGTVARRGLHNGHACLECRAEHWWSSAVNDSGWIAMVGGACWICSAVRCVSAACVESSAQTLFLGRHHHHHPFLGAESVTAGAAGCCLLLSPPAAGAAVNTKRANVCKTVASPGPSLRWRIGSPRCLHRDCFCFLSLGALFFNAAVDGLMIRARALLERVRQLPS